MTQSGIAMHRLFLLPWFSVRFRYLALWIAKHSRGLLALFVACLLGALFTFLRAETLGVIRWIWAHMAAASILQATVVLALLWLFMWAVRARQRIFVSSFEDRTGDAALKEFVSGLPGLLLNELGIIRQLLEDVNETGAAGGARSGESPIQATIRVQDVGETLQKVVTSDSKVKLWGIEIPIGPLIGVFGRLTQGPQLSGSVYKQDGEVTLIARLEGAGFPGTDWRVVSTDLTSDAFTDSAPRMSQMVEQLAYRIFTDLVPTGARRWRAVYAFSQALNHLRITARTGTDKYWNLRQAEARFIEAASEDNKFSPCYYNLGVVYTRLDQHDSAFAAYQKAIEQDPLFAPSYYALALNCWNEANKKQNADRDFFEVCFRYCNQAIALDRNYARAWNLKGLVIRKLKGDDRVHLKESVRNREMAAAIAWRGHCRNWRNLRIDSGASEIAFNCLRNLAVGHGMLQSWRAQSIYRQALSLKPLDADLHYEFGMALDAFRKHKRAARQFEMAANTGGKPLYWVWLAKSQLRANAPLPAIEDSLWKALQGPNVEDAVESEIRNGFSNHEKLHKFIGLVKEDRTIASEVDLADAEDTKLYFERLENLLPAGSRAKWHLAMVIQALRNRVTEDERKRRIQTVAEAVVLDRGLYGSVALALRYRGHEGDLTNALFHAEYAVTLKPLGYWERSVLAEVYWGMGDYQRAETEYNACLDLSPTEFNILSGIATTYLNRGINVFTPDQRKRMFNRVIDNYGRVLKITENQILARDSPDFGEGQLIERGKAHYWLGRFHQELLNCDDAIAELRKAKGLGFKPLESSFQLGSAYLEAKAYDEAEETLRSGIGDLIGAVRALRTARRQNKDQPVTKDPLELPSPKGQEDMQMSELLVWNYLYWALAKAERRGNLVVAARLARKAFRYLPRVASSRRRAPEALGREILGLLALKAGRTQDAIQEWERSVSLAFDCRCYVRLAEAHLIQAQLSQTQSAQWEREIKSARDCCVLAGDADVRRGYTAELTTLRTRVDDAERDKKGTKAAAATA